jgi:hypothetical protein
MGDRPGRSTFAEEIWNSEYVNAGVVGVAWGASAARSRTGSPAGDASDALQAGLGGVASATADDLQKTSRGRGAVLHLELQRGGAGVDDRGRGRGGERGSLLMGRSVEVMDEPVFGSPVRIGSARGSPPWRRWVAAGWRRAVPSEREALISR